MRTRIIASLPCVFFRGIGGYSTLPCQTISTKKAMRAAITTHAMSLKRRLAGSCLWGMKCGTFTNGSAMRVFSSADACLLCSGAFCVVAMVARCGAAEVAVVVLTSANGSGAPQNGQKFSPRAGRPLPQVEQNATSLWGLGAATSGAGSATAGDSLGSLLTSTVNSLTHCGQITTPPLAVSFATVSVCFFPQCGHLSSIGVSVRRLLSKCKDTKIMAMIYKLSRRRCDEIPMGFFFNHYQIITGTTCISPPKLFDVGGQNLMWEGQSLAIRSIALVRSVFSFPFRPCDELPSRSCEASLFRFCGMPLPTG